MTELADLLPWHREAWDYLMARRDHQRLPHALLFSGPCGSGKTAFGHLFARALVCDGDEGTPRPCGECRSCQLSNAGTHPDLHLVVPEEVGKAIRIDAIRGMSAKSVLSAGGHHHRVFVISPADALNRAASNALLKTLEEPSRQTVIILISTAPDRLPATVRSRCQIVGLGLPTTAQLEQWLQGRIPETDRRAAIAIGSGVPHRVLLAHEEKWLERADHTITSLQELKTRRANPIQIAGGWVENGVSEQLDELVRVCCDMIRLHSAPTVGQLYHVGQQADLQTLADGLDLRKLFGYLDTLHQMRRQMVNNLNPQMMMEKLTLDWLQLTRPGAN